MTTISAAPLQPRLPITAKPVSAEKPQKPTAEAPKEATPDTPKNNKRYDDQYRHALEKYSLNPYACNFVSADYESKNAALPTAAATPKTATPETQTAAQPKETKTHSDPLEDAMKRYALNPFASNFYDHTYAAKFEKAVSN